MTSRARSIAPRLRRIALLAPAAALALAAVLAALGAQAAPAAPAAAHKCLVATGSGDPAFVRNFNPYVQGLPSSSFVRGGMYEPLIISTPAGGGRQYKWLAQSYSWSKNARTLTLNIRKGVRWSDGKPLTSADVVYSLTAGRQDKTMDLIGLTRPDTNISSITASGPYKVVIRLKTPDSQFVAATLNGQFVIPKHVVSKVPDIN